MVIGLLATAEWVWRTAALVAWFAFAFIGAEVFVHILRPFRRRAHHHHH